jgi:hypothetical protein
VFASSALDELAEEWRAVAPAVSGVRLTSVMFEQGARPHPPRDVYWACLAPSEVFIGLYWQRYGQAPPGADISGLEEEFDLSARLPKLLYVKEPAPGRDPRLARLPDWIRQQGAISYRTFGGSAELGQLVRDDLAALPSGRFGTAGGSTLAWPGRPACSRPACPACSRSARCGPTRSSGWRRRWGEGSMAVRFVQQYLGQGRP